MEVTWCSSHESYEAHIYQPCLSQLTLDPAGSSQTSPCLITQHRHRYDDSDRPEHRGCFTQPTWTTPMHANGQFAKLFRNRSCGEYAPKFMTQSPGGHPIRTHEVDFGVILNEKPRITAAPLAQKHGANRKSLVLEAWLRFVCRTLYALGRLHGQWTKTEQGRRS
jgi:hypothetical protein